MKSSDVPNDMTNQNRPFWEQKNLREITEDEWESLCDGCGKCCLHRLVDKRDILVAYTCVACHLLDGETARCRDYSNRHSRVPDCIDLRQEQLDKLYWLPPSCAYRLLAEAKPLLPWHPLVTGDPDSTVEAGRSVAGRTISEKFVPPESLEDYVIDWVDE